MITVAAGFPTTVGRWSIRAVPVFWDTDLCGNLDPGLLEQALSPRTRGFSPLTSSEIRSGRLGPTFCDRHGLWLIEDNCDALVETRGPLTDTSAISGIQFFTRPSPDDGRGGAVYTSEPS